MEAGEGRNLGALLRRHRPALVLWALLLSSFLLVVTLYAAYSGPFILKVYELNQIDRAEGRNLSGAIMDYEDYLRVDPESIRVRGLLVSALIKQRRFAEAEEHSKEGLRRATEDQRPVAMLIVARTHLARGKIDAAADVVESVLQDLPNSGEAHYELAQIHLARGEFDEAEGAFGRVRALGPEGSSREYADEWNARLEKLEDYEDEIAGGVGSARRLYELGTELEKAGRLGEARDVYVSAARGEKPPAAAHFWTAVQLEAAGSLDEAAGEYQKASRSAASHPSAQYALNQRFSSRE